MKKICIIPIVIAAFAGYNTYKVYKINHLTELNLINLEALANLEYDSPCVEWVDKPCYDKFYEHISDPNGYHATCSGTSTIVGGKLECGAVTGRQPMFPYENKKCLECVRVASGGEVG